MFIVSCFIILLNLLLMFFHNAFVKVIAFIVEVVVFFAVAVAVYVLFRLGHMYSTQCINCFSFFWRTAQRNSVLLSIFVDFNGFFVIVMPGFPECSGCA